MIVRWGFSIGFILLVGFSLFISISIGHYLFLISGSIDGYYGSIWTNGVFATLSIIGFLGCAMGAGLAAFGPSGTRLSRCEYIILPSLAIGWVLLRTLESFQKYRFGDENEKIVAAWMIAEGGRLYDTIFAHHGPFNYFAAHIIYSMTHTLDISAYRAGHWVFIIICSILTALSPMVSTLRGRLLIAASMLILISTAADSLRAHYLLYHVQAGCLFAVGIGLFFIPTMLGRTVSVGLSFIAGLAMGLAVFAAYSFSVSLSLLLLSSLTLLLLYGLSFRSALKQYVGLILGGIVSIILIFSWIFINGNIIGYAVYHIFFNQFIYSQYIDFGIESPFFQFTRSIAVRGTWSLWIMLAFWMVGVIYIGWILRRQGRLRTPISVIFLCFAGIALLLAILFFNPRSEYGYRAATFEVVRIGILSVLVFGLGPELLAHWRERQVLLRSAIVVVLVSLAISGALSSINHRLRDDIPQSIVEARQEKQTAETIRRHADPDDTILVLEFAPHWYLLSERYPASGHYYYFPWQALYEENPVMGRSIDLCADVEKHEPSVILWERDQEERYPEVADGLACLSDIITRHYHVLQREPTMWIRSEE